MHPINHIAFSSSDFILLYHFEVVMKARILVVISVLGKWQNSWWI